MKTKSNLKSVLTRENFFYILLLLIVWESRAMNFDHTHLFPNSSHIYPFPPSTSSSHSFKISSFLHTESKVYFVLPSSLGSGACFGVWLTYQGKQEKKKKKSKSPQEKSKSSRELFVMWTRSGHIVAYQSAQRWQLAVIFPLEMKACYTSLDDLESWTQATLSFCLSSCGTTYVSSGLALTCHVQTVTLIETIITLENIVFMKNCIYLIMCHRVFMF